MQAGRLDQRVTIERLTRTQNDVGEMIEDWAPVATVWAAVEPLSGREYFAAAGVPTAEITTRIRMRYRPGLSVLDRINHEGTLHGIQTIINPRAGDRELVLMCKANFA